MSDYSKYTNEQLINKIHELEKDLKNNKVYGLVWDREHIPEKVAVDCKNSIPYLEQIDELAIKNGGQENVLIEGDNFHSLFCLNFILKNRVDLIYIDPPYNTGNEDFIYNDNFVNSEDGYRHSKWLSFMDKRLKLARELLNERGCIFISIDDNEQANLKLLCDSIFGEQNFVACICRQAIKGGSRATNIKTVHDYVLIYAKNQKQMIQYTGFKKDAVELDLTDEKGPYTRGRELNKWGAGSRREDSPTMWFPIKGPNGEDVYPIRNDGSEGRWRWGKAKLLKAVEENDVIFEPRGDGTYIVYEKVRGNKTTTTQFNTWFADKYINAKGSESVKKIFNTMMSVFDYAKPVELIFDLLFMANNKNAVVLDFFAGSGTTGHAVLELNKFDGGNRKFILCTNNDNNICSQITYPRLKGVLSGKNLSGDKIGEPISSSLRYLKTSFVPDVEDRDQAKYILVEKVNGLLNVLEDCYDVIEKTSCSFHYSNQDKKHLFIYNDFYSKEEFDKFVEMVNSTSGNKVVYIFTIGNEIDTSLANQFKNADIKPIPTKIYEIYKEVVEDIKREE